jgi:hypothetical protein
MSVFEALKTAGCPVNKGRAANLPDTAKLDELDTLKESVCSERARKCGELLRLFFDKKGERELDETLTKL